ncbi:uncharacterized protein EAE98_002442 [Botrytis deweyae]|uniref:HNH nuclease domain-containing protein n=1 Tax=Botrytis deweyae TaxID=2478750 RepID=A0ABQ7IXC3_9HELO|nr:uncharacterized protein EAE98_002442 [Botrytis deweyae]KAF7936223.1 hypothetical protein EAE98_002442 [Botrytis deweyae]
MSNLADSSQLSKFRMPPEDKALYERIATLEDPTSVTRAEKNQLLGVPPPDEEDRICKEKTGLTMAELENKVMTSSDTLSEEEVNIILFGVMWEPGKQSVNCKRNLLWSMNLVDEEQQLVAKVRDFLANDYDNEIHRLVYNRNRALDAVIKQRREQQRAAMTARHVASRPRWVQELITAKLPQWGFVVFRTDYSEETDEKWRVFKGIYTMTGNTVLKDSWKRASPLIVTSQSIFVSDPVMDGADTDALRHRFKTMRERQEIPNGIAMDCFLVVDEAVLNHNFISSKTLYKPKPLGDRNPWEFALYLRAVDPDHNNPATITPQADTSDFTGEITIPLPKVFDWLYYCFMSKSEDWETRYLTIKGGPAELVGPETPYPAYRSGTEQLLK